MSEVTFKIPKMEHLPNPAILNKKNLTEPYRREPVLDCRFGNPKWADPVSNQGFDWGVCHVIWEREWKILIYIYIKLYIYVNIYIYITRNLRTTLTIWVWSGPVVVLVEPKKALQKARWASTRACPTPPPRNYSKSQRPAPKTQPPLTKSLSGKQVE